MPRPPSPVGVDAGGTAVVLDQPPGRLAVEVPADQHAPRRCQRPEGAFPVFPMPADSTWPGPAGRRRAGSSYRFLFCFLEEDRRSGVGPSVFSGRRNRLHLETTRLYP